jgi:predicted RNA methylase
MNALQKTQSVVRMFKAAAGGAHGNTRGFHGSLTAFSLQKILSAVDPFGKSFVDIGFGTGVVLAAALAAGASKAHGYELPGNEANRYIFQAAMKRWSKQHFYNNDLSRQAVLEFNDVEEVFIHKC